MKTRFRNLFIFLGCVWRAGWACLGLLLAGQAAAQTFTTLYSFTGGSDGSLAEGLILSGNTFYGTCDEGGTSSVGFNPFGTVFAISTNGTGFTSLYTFTVGSDAGQSNGFTPGNGLAISGNKLYGTTYKGGTYNAGTVFAVNTDGTGFTTLYSFTGGSDGGYPSAGLILSGNTLYGTTPSGGDDGDGTVFAIDINGTGFTRLYSFTNGSDGEMPARTLILSSNTLYGVAPLGGACSNGTVFAINTDGTGFTTLHSFAATYTNSDGFLTNSDGAKPQAPLILSGNTLYGTAPLGGRSDSGTVFAVNTDGTGFTTLHSFTEGYANSNGIFTNGDGAAPEGALVLSGNTLYGTACLGGTSGMGTVFAVSTNGTGFTTFYGFTARDDVGLLTGPSSGGLILSGNTLYGTGPQGGTSRHGVVFSLSLPPVTALQLTITLSGTNVVLTWPASPTIYTLQSTANLGSPAVWTAVSPAPVLINGQNTVTNAVSRTQQFYRLSH